MLGLLLLAAPLAHGLKRASQGAGVTAGSSAAESSLDVRGIAKGRPALVPPADLRGGPLGGRPRRTASLVESAGLVGRGWGRSGASGGAAGAQAQGQGLAPKQDLGPKHAEADEYEPTAAFRPAEEFEAEASVGAVSNESQGLPDNAKGAPPGEVFGAVNARTGGIHQLDSPKDWEYSLESGDAIKSFSKARQDVKIITQALLNVTTGFYLDANAYDGETDSNTLLLELLGWRGLCIEPRIGPYISLFGKMRKAWLFLGALSPNDNVSFVGFTVDGDVDQLSGHQVRSYPVRDFLSEMSGRKTIDFWNLHGGGYEAEILEETLLHSGAFIEFGVILVTYSGRPSSRGTADWVAHRTRDATEKLIFEIAGNASLEYVGGLDAYWVNTVEPRLGYRDAVFVNPSYFEKRGIPTPASVKGLPPPLLPAHSPHADWPGFATWDSGFSEAEEIRMIEQYIRENKAAAALVEPIPKANRVTNVNYLES